MAEDMPFKVGDIVWSKFGEQMMIEGVRSNEACCTWKDLDGKLKCKWYKLGNEPHLGNHSDRLVV